MINHQIETLLSSKLYGQVILINFRNLRTELSFQSQELREKFSYESLSQSCIKVDMKGPSKIAGLPGRPEKVNIIHADNLIIIDCHPILSKQGDPLTCYDFIRDSPQPEKTLFDLIQAVISKLKLSQAGVVIDRVEVMAALLGTQETLKFIN